MQRLTRHVSAIRMTNRRRKKINKYIFKNVIKIVVRLGLG